MHVAEFKRTSKLCCCYYYYTALSKLHRSKKPASFGNATAINLTAK